MLLGVLTATVVEFNKVSPQAAHLLLPYLGWSTFAAVLTLDIWKRNPEVTLYPCLCLPDLPSKVSTSCSLLGHTGSIFLAVRLSLCCQVHHASDLLHTRGAQWSKLHMDPCQQYLQYIKCCCCCLLIQYQCNTYRRGVCPRHGRGLQTGQKISLAQRTVMRLLQLHDGVHGRVYIT